MSKGSNNFPVHRVLAEADLPTVDAPAVAFVRETGKWYFRHADERVGLGGWTDYENVRFCADRPAVDVSGPPATRIARYFEAFFGLPTHTDLPGNININNQDVLLMTPEPVRALYGGTPGLVVQHATAKTSQWDLHPEPLGYCALNSAAQGAMSVAMSMGPKRVPRFNYHPNYQLPGGQYCSTFAGCYLEVAVPGFKGPISAQVSAFNNGACVLNLGQGTSEPFYGIGLWPASDPRLIRWAPMSMAAAYPLTKGLVNARSIPIEPIQIGEGKTDAYTPPGKNTLVIRGGEQPGQTSGLQLVKLGDYVRVSGQTSYHRVIGGTFHTTPPINDGLQYAIYEDPSSLIVSPGFANGAPSGQQIFGYAGKGRSYTTYYSGLIRVPIKYTSTGTLGLGAPLPCAIPEGLYRIVADKDVVTAAFRYQDPSFYVYGEEYDRTIFDAAIYTLTVDQQRLTGAWLVAKQEALKVYWESENTINSNLNDWFPAEFVKYGSTFEIASRTLVRRLSELHTAKTYQHPTVNYYPLLQY
jgi:hypothetical protein